MKLVIEVYLPDTDKCHRLAEELRRELGIYQSHELAEAYRREALHRARADIYGFQVQRRSFVKPNAERNRRVLCECPADWAYLSKKLVKHLREGQQNEIGKGSGGD